MQRGIQTRDSTTTFETHTTTLGYKGHPSHPRIQAQVFTLTQCEVHAIPKVILGILSIFGREPHILIDPVSTHYFVSHTFVMHEEQRLEHLDCSLAVVAPIEEALLAGVCIGIV